VLNVAVFIFFIAAPDGKDGATRSMFQTWWKRWQRGRYLCYGIFHSPPANTLEDALIRPFHLPSR